MLFIHVEEPSMEITLNEILPKIIDSDTIDWRIIQHGSKQKLLSDLKNRLSGYKIRSDWEAIKVLILVDRDQDDCRQLKLRLEKIAISAGFPTKSLPNQQGRFQVANRIVVEELEAWFFGDINAVRVSYPKIPSTIGSRAAFRDPDAIRGGTWEALFRLFKAHGYYNQNSTLPKLEVSRRIAPHLNISMNKSRSFRHFISGINALIE